MLAQDIASIPLFSGLSKNQISLIRPLVEICQFPTDQVVFGQGQPADYLYVVIAGEVEISYKPFDGPALTVTRVCKGGVFGWSAALGHAAYTSSAICHSPTEAYRITGKGLHCLCLNHPETGTIILEHLANVIAERLRSTNVLILDLLGQGIDDTGSC
jgi:CRP-like cAMP-binding protein